MSGTKRAIFRSLHESGFFIIPNAWDAGSAVRLERLGFKAIASTSAGAAWALGREDGEISLGEALAHLRMLVGATALPINADFENGFADKPDEVARNAVLAAETGVAGLSIEDWSPAGLYDVSLAADRIAATRTALDGVDPAILLVGRHEAYRDPSLPPEVNIARAVAYAEAGADCLFVPGMNDHGAIAELVKAVAPKPVNVVVQRYDERLAQLAAMGVRRCSAGSSLAAAAWAAFDAAARTLRDHQP